jgi:hypothetical protein
LIDADPAALQARMTMWLDPDVEFADLERAGHPLTKSATGFNPKLVRKTAIERFEHEGAFNSYLLRAFEDTTAYVSHLTTLWNRSRRELTELADLPANSFVLSRQAKVSEPEGVPILFSPSLFDNDAQRGHSYGFARTALHKSSSLAAKAEIQNVSPRANAWFDTLDPCPADRARALWRHVLAVGYSPAYLSDNDTGLKKGWPRVPLPAEGARLAASERLGERLEVLLDPRTSAPGVTGGAVAPLHRLVGALSKASYRLAANWGSRTRDGKVMPGRGHITQRDWSDQELEAIAAEAAGRSLDPEQMIALLGGALDVHLNGEAQWRSIPASVWDYHIGGYQVLKKWLSYREHAVLGRDITPAEATHFRDIARRLTEIVLMGPALDENYADCAANAYVWPH